MIANVFILNVNDSGLFNFNRVEKTHIFLLSDTVLASGLLTVGLLTSITVTENATFQLEGYGHLNIYTLCNGCSIFVNTTVYHG